jgi:hypothetical protein
MKFEELLRIRELLDAGPKPQAAPDLWEHMAQMKDTPVYRKFTPMAPPCEIPAFRPAQREEPKAISFAKVSIPPTVEVERAASRTINLKPTTFSLEEKTRHDRI